MTNIAIRMPGIVGIAAISATVAPAGQYALRRALEPAALNAGRFIDYDGAHVNLHAGIGLAVDAHEAERTLRRATTHADYARAIELLGTLPREEAVAAWLRPHVRHWRGRTP